MDLSPTQLIKISFSTRVSVSTGHKAVIDFTNQEQWIIVRLDVLNGGLTNSSYNETYEMKSFDFSRR